MKTHCWKDYEEWVEEQYGSWSEEHVAAREISATCMLPKGHEGPHVWTSDEDIGITFK